MIAALRRLKAALTDWANTESITAMLHQESLATAERIARAITDAAPAGHPGCGAPGCAECGRAAQARLDRAIAMAGAR